MTIKNSISPELFELLGATSIDTELPFRLTEGVYQYLNLSAEEKEQQSLLNKASFAVQKRQWTCLYLNAEMHKKDSIQAATWQFVFGAVDFLEKNIDETNLISTLHKKRKNFAVSTKAISVQTWPVDYLLKEAFLAR
jgi:hypothetical protein